MTSARNSVLRRLTKRGPQVARATPQTAVQKIKPDQCVKELFHPVPFQAVGKRDDDGDHGSTDKGDAQ